MAKTRVTIPWGQDILSEPHNEAIVDYLTRAQLVCNSSGGKCDQPVQSVFHGPDVTNLGRHILGLYPYNADKQLFNRMWISWLSARESVQPGDPSVDYSLDGGTNWVTCVTTHALPFALTPPFAGSAEVNSGATVVNISGLTGLNWLAWRQSQTNGVPGDHSSWVVTALLYHVTWSPF